MKMKQFSLTINGKNQKNLNYGKTTESYLGHQIVKKGDIIFTPRDFDCTRKSYLVSVIMMDV